MLRLKNYGTTDGFLLNGIKLVYNFFQKNEYTIAILVPSFRSQCWKLLNHHAIRFKFQASDLVVIITATLLNTNTIVNLRN